MIGHPSLSKINGAGVWYGPEIEGRLSTTRPITGFVERGLTSAELHKLAHHIASGAVHHVFITERFDAWASVPELLDNCGAVMISVGATTATVDAILAMPWISRARLVVRANEDAAWVFKLRAGDEVSVGIPYHLATFAVEHAVITTPDAYTEDSLDP